MATIRGVHFPSSCDSITGSRKYFYYHNDSNGTPLKLTEQNGRVVWEATYDAFGNCNIIKEEIKNNLRFPGQYFDEESGLYYNWNRYYDPVIGRYTQTDPEGEGLNLYAYCFNNPTGLVDSEGTHAIASVLDIFNTVLSFIPDNWVGAQWGQQALETWMDYAVQNDSLIGYGMAAFASLWTSDTWRKTAMSLMTSWSLNGMGNISKLGAGERLGGIRTRQVGNYWVKEVNPNASRISQWYGRKTLKAQASAFKKLGDMAPSYIYKNGKIITRDVGEFFGNGFWKIWAEGSKRLGTPFNDIRPRNIGANGQIFDPVLPPFGESAYWGLLGTAGFYAWELFKGDN